MLYAVCYFVFNKVFAEKLLQNRFQKQPRSASSLTNMLLSKMILVTILLFNVIESAVTEGNNLIYVSYPKSFQDARKYCQVMMMTEMKPYHSSIKYHQLMMKHGSDYIQILNKEIGNLSMMMNVQQAIQYFVVLNSGISGIIN